MREHCMSADSRELFSADNYGTKTASRVEWYFVVDPEHGLAILGCISWPVEKKLLQRVGDGKQDISRAGREMPRQAKPPFAFIAALREKNAQLKDHEEEPLGDEEFSAARLYTGPMCALACTDETALAVRFQSVQLTSLPLCPTPGLSSTTSYYVEAWTMRPIFSKRIWRRCATATGTPPPFIRSIHQL